MDQRLATVARTHQLEFVDAPVSGSDGPAREGKLMVLASGPRGSARYCSPIRRPRAEDALAWAGRHGTRLKLVLNNWLVSQVEAVAETIALTQALGLIQASS